MDGSCISRKGGTMSRYKDFISVTGSFSPDNIRFPESKPKEAPFEAWNLWPQRNIRNCYAFASDAFSPGFKDVLARMNLSEGERASVTVRVPRPGTTGGRPFDELEPQNLRTALVADGFVALPYKDQKRAEVPVGHYLIAGYCWEDQDYHFYRRHSDGTWYHKGGWQSPVTNRDGSDAVIWDVQKADREEYEKFIGFFLSPPDRPAMNILVEDGKGRLLFGKDPTAEKEEALVSHPAVLEARRREPLPLIFC